MKVVRLGEMDADQTVDSVREAELLSNLHNEHIVKVKKINLTKKLKTHYKIFSFMKVFLKLIVYVLLLNIVKVVILINVLKN